MAISVATEVLWIDPWTVLVEIELEMTPPDVCDPSAACETRSWKLVSVSLYPVVCELAMLPEMFCNANDCACRPATAVVNASKIPMTSSPTRSSTNIGIDRQPAVCRPPAQQTPCHLI